MSKLEQEFKKETNACPIEGVDLYKIEYISWMEKQIQQLQADKEGFLKLINRTLKDCNEVQYRDTGHICESRKVVEKIQQRFKKHQDSTQGG